MSGKLPGVPVREFQKTLKDNGFKYDRSSSGHEIWERKQSVSIPVHSKESVLKHIYDYMRQNYGICWEQEAKDYKERNNLSYSPKTIEVVYQNEDLRSIFMAVLTDVEYKAKEVKEEKNKIDWSDRQVLPLVKKYDDHSNGFMVTYKKVYTRMEENSRVGWKNLTTRYINECGGKPTKKDLINTRKSLQKKFTKAIEELMEE